MKGIKIYTSIEMPCTQLNGDALAIKIEKDNAVFLVADGKVNNGICSTDWARFLCNKTPLVPISSLNGYNYFIDHIWEEFYEETHKKLIDPFAKTNFMEKGSLSTYCALWFRQDKQKTYYQWLSYGNSSVLVYDKKQDELFVPKFNDSLVGFLKNEGLVNWNNADLQEKYLLLAPEKELDQDKLIILATDAMAEYLVLSYLIIKSRDDFYWEKLSLLMKSDPKLSDLIFNNRDSYAWQSFLEVLDTWKLHQTNNTLTTFVTQLQQDNKIAKDDLTFTIISYDPHGPEYITSHQSVIIKSLPQTLIPKPIKLPVPKPVPKKPEFKRNQDAYIDVLLDNGVRKFYHFTDRSNLALIKKQGGLYSWHYLDKNGIQIPMPAADQLSKMLDARHGLENFVRISICSNHPMMHRAKNDGRISDPVILEIDPVVVSWYDTLFSDRNATSNEHLRGGSLGDLKRIHFETCLKVNHFQLEDNEKQFYQAEILVWEFIPSKYILNLDKL